jgi:hypothetical protein
VARHVVSHAVTVTSCDNVLRVSRHIRPPIRGGVDVTCDKRCGEGWKDLLTGMSALIFNENHFCRIKPASLVSRAARVRDSFAALMRTRTTGRAPTHQRPSWQALGPILGPRCQHAAISISKINWFEPSRHRFGHSVQHFERDLARVSNHVFHSVGSVDARTPGSTQALPNGKCQFPWLRAKTGRQGWVGAPPNRPADISTYRSAFAPDLWRILVGLGLKKFDFWRGPAFKIWRRPVLKMLVGRE